MRQEAAAGPRSCSRIARRPTIVVSLPQTHHTTEPSEQGFAPPLRFWQEQNQNLILKKAFDQYLPPPSNRFPTALHHSTAQARVPKMQQTMPGMSGLSDAAASRAATGASDAPATPAAAAAATASIVTGISNDDDDYVSSNRSVGVKKLSRHVIPVEYWIPSTSVWTESAQLSLSRAKTKLYIDIEDNSSSGLNNIGRRGSSRCY